MSRYLWDMQVNEIIATEATDLKLTFSEINLKSFQKMYTFTTPPPPDVLLLSYATFF